MFPGAKPQLAQPYPLHNPTLNTAEWPCSMNFIQICPVHLSGPAGQSLTSRSISVLIWNCPLYRSTATQHKFHSPDLSCVSKLPCSLNSIFQICPQICTQLDMQYDSQFRYAPCTQVAMQHKFYSSDPSCETKLLCSINSIPQICHIRSSGYAT